MSHERHAWPGGIDGVAFVRDWGLFSTGRAILITNGHDRKDIHVNFDLPHNWNATTPWTRLNRRPNSFVARDLEDLRESMLLAGTHKEFTIRRNGFELIFALGGKDIVASEAQYRSMANGVMDYYIALMGGIPNPPPSNKFSRSVVIINPGKDTDGEVIGNNINIILDPRGDAGSQVIGKFIFAHEFFHLWNGKSIIPKDSTDEWFKEGFTNYYALKALRRIGAIEEKDVFDTLNGLFYKRYSGDPALGRSSIRGVASGDDKHKHWGMIYGGGLFAGICQDINIRTATSNRKSLDDLMRSFFKRFGGTDATYTTADTIAALKALGGTDQDNFFARFIYGVERIPIETCLSNAGLLSTIENGELKVTRRPGQEKMISSILGK
jgi:predicted metalloprotease with PDZ domain